MMNPADRNRPQQLDNAIMATKNHADEWYLFEMELGAILEYLERKTGSCVPLRYAVGREANRWHMAIRNGLLNHLHLNVGIPGVEVPEHPIEENESAIMAALLMGHGKLPVILSGEWEIAVREGLITREQLLEHESALFKAVEACG